MELGGSSSWLLTTSRLGALIAAITLLTTGVLSLIIDRYASQAVQLLPLANVNKWPTTAQVTSVNPCGVSDSRGLTAAHCLPPPCLVVL